MSFGTFNRINIAAPNLMVVCFDKVDAQEGKGRLYNYYSKDAAEFENEYQLLMLMEKVMEDINYPQSAVIMRDYKDKKTKDQVFQKELPPKVMDQEEILGKRGKEATFVVYVQYRQKATWQGEVVWVEENKTRNFRSALELLKLIYNAQDR